MGTAEGTGMSDEKRFEVFMTNYQNMVFSTAVRLLGNEAQAEDISQEVFLKAYRHFAEIGSSPSAGGWLKTVTTHLCLNHLTRYRNRWRFFSEMAFGDDEETSTEKNQTSDTASPSDALEALDRQAELEAALRKLPEAQRVPLVLYHFEDLSYDAIATKLNISLSKVKTDIARGREKLREVYQRSTL